MRSEIKKSSGWLERVEVMESLAEHLETSAASFRNGDLPTARAALDSARNERARLGRMRSLSAEGMPETPEEIAAMRQVGRLAKSIGSADDFLKQRIQDNTENANGDALSDDEQTNRLIDGVLPNSWDLANDLIVLVGQKAKAFCEVFRERGYGRVLVLAEDPEDETQTSDGALSLEQARAKLEDYQERPPHKLRLITAGQSAHDSEELARKIQVWLASLNAGTNTQMNFGQTWALNCIANLPQLLQSTNLKKLQNRFKDKPCVVVAPGPSLTKNIDVLAAHRDRFVVFAVSHALRSLTTRGITPDFVVNVDPQPVVNGFFEGIDTHSIPALLFTVSSDPQLWKLPAKNKICFTTNMHAESWIREFGVEPLEVPTGGTVSHAAIMCADYMGFSPILLMGQDLAMTGGQIYEDALAAGQLANTKDLIKVEGINGDEVLTNFQFNQYREWLENLVSNRNDLRIINCTEGGAKIQGMEHSTLAEQIPENDLDGFVLEEQKTLDTPDLLHLLKKVNARNRSLDEIKRVTRRCIRLCEKMKTDNSVGNDLNNAEEELKRKTKTIVEVSVYLAKRIKIVNQYTGDLRNIDQALQFSSALYSDLVKACESFENAYKICAETARTQMREAEERA